MNTMHNARLALRSLLRSPGFTIAATLTLAIGIGLSTAVFTIADAILLRPLPVRDQQNIVLVSAQKLDLAAQPLPLSYEDVQAFATRSQALQKVAWFGYEGAARIAIRNHELISQTQRALVSGDFFSVLDARPVIGRVLTADDDKQGAAPVAVISYKLWQKDFVGSLDVIGKTIERHDDGRTFAIVGVMPKGFDFPRGTEFWAPINAATPANVISQLAYSVIGRLKPSASAINAAQDMTAFFAGSGRAATRDLRGEVETFTEAVVGDTKPAVIAFSVAVLLLLLITCFNVANLLFVRGIGRTREIGIRAALGATRTEIVWQLLTENAILALLGGVLGIGVAALSVKAFIVFAPANLPRVGEVQLNMTALTGAVVITAFALLVFAITPALLTSRASIQNALKSGGRHGTSRKERWFMESLIGAQIAFAVLALSAAGVTAASLLRLQNANLAFDGSNVLIGDLAVRVDQFGSAASQLELMNRLLPAIQESPGVIAVSPVVAAPFSGAGGWDGAFAVDDQSKVDASGNALVNMEVVAPSYFRAFRIAPIRGRLLTDADRAETSPVIVISEATARQFWPNSDAVGKQIHLGKRQFTVVGIVPNTRYRDLRTVRLSAYFPLQQSFFPFVPLTLAIRTSSRSSKTISSVREVVARVAPGVVLVNAAPFDSYLNIPLAQPRLNAVLLAVFGSTAVVLAGIGLFGTMMTMVRLRTRELGVRMALGASTQNVRGLVLKRGWLISAIGLTAGIVAAVGLNQVLRTMLFETTPSDPVVLALVVAILLAVTTIASLIPAWSTTGISPANALNSDV